MIEVSEEVSNTIGNIEYEIVIDDQVREFVREQVICDLMYSQTWVKVLGKVKEDKL
jgi:hypothetical protein